MHNRVPKELQDEWNAKLAESNFKDIEHAENKDFPLQHQLFSLHSTYVIPPHEVAQLSKLLETHKFSKARDRHILQLHLDGLSTRSIQRRVAQMWPEISQQRVSQILMELRKLSETL